MTRIPLQDLFARAIDAVETAGIPYVVYGGIALPAWGEPVPTQDLDLVIHVDEGTVPRLMTALRTAGFRVPDDAEIMFPIDTWTRATIGGRDVDLALGATEFDRVALSRAVPVELFGRTVPVVTAEDLILYKLVAHRRKDLAHVEGILLRQAEKLDVLYLRAWARGIAEATGRFEVPSILHTMLAEHDL